VWLHVWTPGALLAVPNTKGASSHSTATGVQHDKFLAFCPSSSLGLKVTVWWKHNLTWNKIIQHNLDVASHSDIRVASLWCIFFRNHFSLFRRCFPLFRNPSFFATPPFSLPLFFSLWAFFTLKPHNPSDSIRVVLCCFRVEIGAGENKVVKKEGGVVKKWKTVAKKWKTVAKKN
jgi:hypothetical protein